MKNILFLVMVLFSASVSVADTPPPGTVKAKMFSGDGNTAATFTGSGLNVNVTNGSLSSTVAQGAAGSSSWLEQVTSSALPANACKETGGNLAEIVSLLESPLAVTGTFWQTTQPVSGTFWQTTQPVSASSLPLPTGAATSAKQPALGTAGISSTDVLSIQGIASMTALKVDGSAVTQPVSGTFWPATQPVSGTVAVSNFPATQPVSGTFWQTTQPVSAASLPLPTGASTSAKQPALGVAGTPSADVISIQGVTSMTALKTDGSGTTQPVSGTVTANAGTGTFTVDASGHTVPVSGTFFQATQPVSGTFWQTTQPVSGTVTANIGTSGSLALNSSVTGLQVAQGSTTSGQSGSLTLGAVTTSAPVYSSGQSSPFSLTVAGGLRVDGSGTTQPVSGTFWQATQPVSAASLPLPSGAATSALQTTGNTSLSTISGQLPSALGAKTTTNSMAVNIASDQTVAVSGTFFQSTQPVSLTTLPSLVAGTALVGKVGIDQTTVGTTNAVSIGQIGSTTAATGNGVSGSGTLRVNIASDNSAITVNATPVVPTALTVKQASVTIGTTAVRLTNDGLAPASTRVLLVAQLDTASTANCYFGSSTVTTSGSTQGVQMFAGQVFSFSKDAGNYYAICNAVTQTFHITEQE